jgi:hypothetical protein
MKGAERRFLRWRLLQTRKWEEEEEATSAYLVERVREDEV